MNYQNGIESLISEKAQHEVRMSLYQALNQKRIIGFVGSGVSVAYGRVTWKELVIGVKDKAIKIAEQFIEENLEKPNIRTDLIERLKEDIQDLSEQSLKEESNYSSGGQSNILILELCQKMLGNIKSDPPVQTFRDMVKSFVIDDESYAKTQLTKTIENLNGLIFQKPSVQLDTLNSCRSFYRESLIKGLHKIAKSLGLYDEYAIELSTMNSLVEQFEGEDSYLKPDLRNLVDGVLFILSKILFKVTDVETSKEFELKMENHIDEHFSRKDEVDKVLEYIRPSNDPISSIFNRLKIRRFLTTNYDLELEKYLERFELKLGAFTSGLMDKEAGNDGNSHVTISRIGKRVRSMVFRKENVAELLEFAAGMPDIHTDIFHLHGRVGLLDSVVATETDYQNIYLKNDSTRLIFNEALDSIFGGNSVLFIGLGMGEADLLRPLRQFVSNRTQGQDKPLFALLPANQNKFQRHERAMELKIRYGIHTIFYGEKNDDDTASLEEEYGLLKAIIGILKHSPIEQREDSSSALPAIQKSKLKSLLTAKLSESKYAPELFQSGFFDLSHNHEALNSLINHHFPIVSQMKEDRIVFEYVLRQILLFVQDASDETSIVVEHSPLITPFLSKLAEKMLTISLCEEIKKIEVEWHDWWSKKNSLLSPRIVDFSNVSLESQYVKMRYRLKHEAAVEKNIRLDDRASHFIKELNLKVSENTDGGNIFIVRNRSGGGKGVFVQNLFLELKEGAAKKHNKMYLANASSSCEYLSVIESVVEFLQDIAEQPTKKTLLVSERLAELLQIINQSNDKSRHLLVFSNIDFLFSNKGWPVSTKIKLFIDALLDCSNKKIDLIFITRNKQVEQYLCQNYRCGCKPRCHAIGYPLGTIMESKQASKTAGNYAKERETNSILNRIYKQPISCFSYSIIQATKKAIEGRINGLKGSKEEVKFESNQLEGKYVEWLKNVQHSISATAKERVDFSVVDNVVDFYSSFSRMTGDLGLQYESSIDSLVLRHLAFIQIPVEAEVLVNSRTIKKLYGDFKKAYEKQGNRDLLDLVQKSLVRLSKHCLVSTICKRTDSDVYRSIDADRYSIHTNVRHYIFNRIGNSSGEKERANFYDMSTYCIQPRDLPPLTPESYSILACLVDDLTLEVSDQPNESKLAVASSSLRCALAVLRSSFTVASVSRLEEHIHHDSELLSNGKLFDDHSRRLGLLVKRAFEWQAKCSQVKSVASGEQSANLFLSPYFRDEIVWLYNERGLVNLVQGKLYSAIPLFERALNENSDKIEYEQDGPNWAKVSFNFAVAQIDRGNLSQAKKIFERIIQVEDKAQTVGDKAQSIEGKDSNKALSVHHWFAKGYLALIGHMRGYFNPAKNKYLEVIENLERLESSRGVSIFSRHLGDLYRSMGDYKEAYRSLDRAISAAEMIRDQDILHLARVAQACVLQHFDAGRAIPLLNLAQQFATDMSVPKLEAEALLVHGNIVLSQGENKIAGEMAIKSLAICSKHGLTLRKISSLVLLGHINLLRRNNEAGMHLLRTSIRIAERYGYPLQIERAQQLILASEAGQDELLLENTRIAAIRSEPN